MPGKIEKRIENAPEQQQTQQPEPLAPIYPMYESREAFIKRRNALEREVIWYIVHRSMEWDRAAELVGLDAPRRFYK